MQSSDTAAAAMGGEFDDEFEGTGTAGGTSGYGSIADGGDVEGVRERKFIADKTPCTLEFEGMELDTEKGNTVEKASVVARFAVTDPEEYADGSADFAEFFGISTKVSNGAKASRWDILRGTCFRIVAGILRKRTDDPEVRGFLAFTPGEVDVKDPLGSVIPYMIERMNTLKGRTFNTHIRFVPEVKEPNGNVKYRAKQQLGAIQFPGCKETKRRKR